MKKKFFLVCVIALLAGAVNVFADHPGDKVGIGLFAGGGGGTVGNGFFYPGLTLKVPTFAVFWGVNGFIGAGSAGLGVSADYYILDKDLVKDGSFDLDWFLGVGAFAHIYFGSNSSVGLGVRIPIGLSWHINNIFELFIDVTPGIGLNIPPVLYLTAGAELGLRVWL
jgi:hypothetical protein